MVQERFGSSTLLVSLLVAGGYLFARIASSMIAMALIPKPAIALLELSSAGRPGIERHASLDTNRISRLFDALGFRTDDVIHSINGVEMKSPDAGLDTDRSLRSLRRLLNLNAPIRIELERQGNSLVNTYVFRCNTGP